MAHVDHVLDNPVQDNVYIGKMILLIKPISFHFRSLRRVDLQQVLISRGPPATLQFHNLLKNLITIVGKYKDMTILYYVWYNYAFMAGCNQLNFYSTRHGITGDYGRLSSGSYNTPGGLLCAL